MNLDRFRLPDEPTDRDLKINALYYKRLDILEEMKELQSKVESLEEAAWQIERQLNDMGCSVC